ncbi:MAG: serine/threonine protein kinase [Planctomycetota bacterium]|nr:MAG: serine/threonine protein kinase [Planctomycetota bacterium]
MVGGWVAAVVTLAGCNARPIEEVEPPPTVAEVEPPRVTPDDSPWWRGLNGDGRPATRGITPDWNLERASWATPIPGRGHADPTVVGERVYVPTAREDEQVQSVLCLDRASGKILWETVVHRGHFSRKHPKNSHASSTIACDGRFAFVAFLNDDAIHLTALKPDGEIAWSTRVGDFRPKHGYSPSPAIHGPLVIVAGDNEGGGFLAAVHRRSGQIVWKRARPSAASLASPRVVTLFGKPQIVLAGCNRVAAYDPGTGRLLWECPGVAETCVGTVVTDGERVFASGGYPETETLAVLADGSGRPAWRNRTHAYVPSLLWHDGFLYVLRDSGTVHCFEAASGEERWKKRLGGTFSASPVLIDDWIVVVDERGRATMFRASGERYEQLATAQLGDEMFATPVACGSEVFLRIARYDGDRRQESIVRLGPFATEPSGDAQRGVRRTSSAEPKNTRESPAASRR